MGEHKYRFLLEDKERLLRLFAFLQGWRSEWVDQQQKSMERLYKRKFEKIEVATELMYLDKHYPIDDHNCLDHYFLQAFFSNFPNIEILNRPDITFVSQSIPPRIETSYSYEDAWKHHAQVLVLMKPDKRIEYLYQYIPENLKKILEDRAY